jgi:YVTN family beta-propeller protein
LPGYHFAVAPFLKGIAYDGEYLWIAGNSGQVAEWNPITALTVNAFTTGTGASGVTFDGNYIWVTNTGSNTVSKLTTINTGQVARSFPTGNGPSGVISDGTNLWVANVTDNTVSRF